MWALANCKPVRAVRFIKLKSDFLHYLWLADMKQYDRYKQLCFFLVFWSANGNICSDEKKYFSTSTFTKSFEGNKTMQIVSKIYCSKNHFDITATKKRWLLCGRLEKHPLIFNIFFVFAMSKNADASRLMHKLTTISHYLATYAGFTTIFLKNEKWCSLNWMFGFFYALVLEPQPSLAAQVMVERIWTAYGFFHLFELNGVSQAKTRNKN